MEVEQKRGILMSVQINMKREIEATLNSAIDRITAALKTEGFGVLTRIDLHTKIKEKLGKEISPAVILGACNPQLAYEAYVLNSDVASLLPCNAVVRETGPGKVSIELVKPSSMMTILGDQQLVNLSKSADLVLLKVLERV
jgi:uncharacterized protein (DUF302 family)